MERLLIVSADDFGQSEGINRGVIEAFEQGVVTSASLMVRWPASRGAAGYARRHPELDVGLHLDLGESAYRDGIWEALYVVAPLDNAEAVAHEARRQLARFQEALGAVPTHIDSHQHVHLRPAMRPIIERLARELDVPLRGVTPEVAYRGDFYGQTADGAALPGSIAFEHLVQILDDLGPGVTELGCHPGYAEDLETMYRSERAEEVAVLGDGRVRAAITSRGITLCSFRDIKPGMSRGPAGRRP